jgi:hypothetical protein
MLKKIKHWNDILNNIYDELFFNVIKLIFNCTWFNEDHPLFFKSIAMQLLHKVKNIKLLQSSCFTRTLTEKTALSEW